MNIHMNYQHFFCHRVSSGLQAISCKCEVKGWILQPLHVPVCCVFLYSQSNALVIQLGTSASLGLSVALSSTMSLSLKSSVLVIETMSRLNSYFQSHSLCMFLPTRPPHGFCIFTDTTCLSHRKSCTWLKDQASSENYTFVGFFSIGAMLLSSEEKD